MSSSSGSGRTQKGAANVTGGWIGDLQKPSGPNCPQGRIASEAGYRRCHGEAIWVDTQIHEDGV